MLDLSFLADPLMGTPLWAWAFFAAVVFVLLVLDLGVFHRKARKPKFSKSVTITLFYISMALLFGVFVWVNMGAEKAMEYYTGYVIEQSLSLDNVFVISMIFASLGIPSQYQHRVLFWGLLSVLVLRGIMIFIGAALVAEFAWILAIFGVFLLFTGVRMFFSSPETEEIENNRTLKWMRKHLRITRELHGTRFMLLRPHPKSGKPVLWVTPLFVVLVLVELADVMFAVDSVPAVFAITQDPYIVYTSNIFAVLGLRALYFTLAAMVNRFSYLSKALALVLVFVGAKILYTHFSGHHVPIEYSLGGVLAILLGGIGLSLAWPKKSAR